jgi:molybdopterin converting factor small subunit
METKSATGTEPVQPSGALDMTDLSGPNMRIGDVRVGPTGDVETLQQLDDQLNQIEEVPVSRLSSHLKRLWDRAVHNRMLSGVDDELTESLLTNEGQYSETQKAILAKQDEPLVFEPITGDICSNAVSWIEDMLNLPEGNIYSLDATPLPDMPDNVVEMIIQKVMQKVQAHIQQTGIAPQPDEIFEMAQQLRMAVEQQVKVEADERADAMNKLISDQFIEGGFWEALLTVVNDMAIFPTAWLKGPVIYRDEELEWTVDKDGPVPKVGEILKPQWYAPSPLDMFPSPQTKRINEGYLFERMRFEPSALSAFKGVPGFNDDAIDRVLERYGVSGHGELTPQDQVRARLEKRYGELMSFDGVIEVCEFSGKVAGKLLKEFGFTQKLDDNRYYPILAWQCDSECIMARLNTNPLGEWNVSAGSYRLRPGSIWGKGIPQVIREDQKKANGYARAASTNAAEASGPQTIVDVSQMADGQEITGSYPRKIWQTKGMPPGASNAARKAIEHFQPAAIFVQLEQQIERVKKQADQRAGIPPFAYGSDNNRGAADTVGGLSILMNNAAKGLRSILRHMDSDILRPTVKRIWFHNMLYHPDNSVKGDVQVKARGAMGQVVKESMFLRRQDFLAKTANPVDAEIVGLEGRRKQLEEQEATLDYPKNSIVPTKEELADRLKVAQMPPAAGGGQPAPEQGALPAPGGEAGKPQDVVVAGKNPAQ